MITSSTEDEDAAQRTIAHCWVKTVCTKKIHVRALYALYAVHCLCSSAAGVELGIVVTGGYIGVHIPS